MRKGFVLSELLIIVGIIGIIFALLLPDLLAYVQKHVLVNQLKVTYSSLNNGFKRLIASYETADYTDTGLDFVSTLTLEAQKKWDAEFHQAFRIKYVCMMGDNSCNYDISSLSRINPMTYRGLPMSPSAVSNNRYTFILNNGSLVSFYAWGKCDAPSPGRAEDKYKTCGYLSADVNGYKPPNVIGRDIFNFELFGDGSILPEFGTAALFRKTGSSNTASYGHYWEHTGDYGDCDPESSEPGNGCAGRIMDGGWVMNY
jgi:Tfp pilus assembly major pilin PilA